MWFKKTNVQKNENQKDAKKLDIPAGLWIKCKYCKEIIYRKEAERNFNTCPKCNYHFCINARERLKLLCDKGVYTEFDKKISSVDPLKFKSSISYKDKLKENQQKTGYRDAITNVEAELSGYKVIMSVMDFNFMGGSMGSVVGEKITSAIERCIEKKLAFIAISASGGARMQEGVFSLMQMAKTSAAVARLDEAGLLFISILTDPTTGGVSASFAMQGDIIIAEPKALIGFAGPRVIEQTIGQKLPDGFQRAEFLLEHGLIDMITERKNLKSILSNVLSFFYQNKLIKPINAH
ncbi:MAG: acetyl-CoA carboxylase, carboxyltransferase subunit beta [bacterium]